MEKKFNVITAIMATTEMALDADALKLTERDRRNKARKLADEVVDSVVSFDTLESDTVELCNILTRSFTAMAEEGIFGISGTKNEKGTDICKMRKQSASRVFHRAYSRFQENICGTTEYKITGYNPFKYESVEVEKAETPEDKITNFCAEIGIDLLGVADCLKAYKASNKRMTRIRKAEQKVIAQEKKANDTAREISRLQYATTILNESGLTAGKDVSTKLSELHKAVNQ